jgi:hypothetical protein
MVVAFAPKLSTVDAVAQTAILAWANDALDVSAFDDEGGPTTQLARIYLAAHAGTMNRQGANGAGGPLTMRAAGGITEQWATPAGGVVFDSLDSTPYGKLYRQLVNMSGARGPFVLDGT